MGDAKRRREAGMAPQTVRLPALTHDEFHVLHHLMHLRLHQLRDTPADQMTDELRAEQQALMALHHKIFQH